VHIPRRRVAGNISVSNHQIREKLLALLPSQADARILSASTNAWLFMMSPYKRFDDIHKDADPAFTFDILAVSKQAIIVIAKTLLWLALCMQQLPPDFDEATLSLTGVDQVMDTYVSTISSLVTSEPSLVASMDGLECLIVLGMFLINAGSLQRSWLVFRQALNTAQLMGIGKHSSSVERNQTSETDTSSRRFWQSINNADRYLSLMLGVASGIDDDELKGHDSLSQMDLTTEIYYRLCVIANHINKRNRTGHPRSLIVTLETDGMMESLERETPVTCWQIPPLNAPDRSCELATEIDLLIQQMWYHQLKALLHLPFAFILGAESRYSHNRLTCFQASRELLYRYLSLRRMKNTQLTVKVQDFGAFIACIILILSLLESSSPDVSESRRRETQKDQGLVQEIISTMEELSRSKRETVAQQSVHILKVLYSLQDQPDIAGERRNVCLNIPFFGSIRIAFPGNNPNSNSSIMPHNPVLEFRSEFDGGSHANASFTPYGHRSSSVSFSGTDSGMAEAQIPPDDQGFQDMETFFFNYFLNENDVVML
jgi:hypothetical protein